MGAEPKKVCGLVMERDRGYAWVILAASYLPQMASIGFAYSVAILLQAWKIEYGSQHSFAMISAVGSLNCALLFGCGVIASVLIEKFGHRMTVVIGGLFTTIGYVISFFAVNIWMLMVGYGVFVGVGFSLIYMGSVTIVSLWFDKYRSTACGIASSGNGIGTFANAMLLDIFIQSSGWRATMLYQACIVAQCCVVGMLLLPPPPVKAVSGKASNKKNAAGSPEEAEPLAAANGNGEAVVKAKPSGFFADAKQLFKSSLFICYFIDNFIWPLGVVLFYSFAVRLAMDVGGFELPSAAWSVSCIGLVDAFSRIITGFLSSTFRISPSVFYFIGQFGYGIVIAVAPLLHEFVNPFAASIAFGLFFGCQLGSLVTTTAELFDPEKISTVLGVIILANGVGNGFGPIVGDLLLQALDNSFRVVFTIYGILVLLGLVLMAPFLISYWRKLASKAPAKQNLAVANDSAFGILDGDERNDEI